MSSSKLACLLHFSLNTKLSKCKSLSETWIIKQLCCSTIFYYNHNNVKEFNPFCYQIICNFVWRLCSYKNKNVTSFLEIEKLLPPHNFRVCTQWKTKEKRIGFVLKATDTWTLVSRKYSENSLLLNLLQPHPLVHQCKPTYHTPTNTGTYLFTPLT